MLVFLRTLNLNFNMRGKYFYFLCVLILFLIFAQLFIFSTYIKTDDFLHQNEFNKRYGIFSIVQPNDLNFCDEAIPIYSSDIWERLDKQLLKKYILAVKYNVIF